LESAKTALSETFANWTAGLSALARIAPLVAVAWLSAKPSVLLPTSQNPTMYDPSGRPGLLLSSDM
jgi:hypothetical protein